MKFFFMLLLVLSGCNLTRDTVDPAANTPIPTSIPNTNENSWKILDAGYEQRTLRTENNNVIHAIRINPNQYTFRAHYNSSTPLTIDQWRDALPLPTAVINANFFGTQNEVLGLLISDGAVYGQSYRRGGTFIVQNGVPRIRSTPNEPYYIGEPLEQAVQAFPMLVLDGLQAYTSETDFAPSRRTAIGQDSEGRILIFVSLTFGMSLPQFSEYLATEATLDLQHAFNLDGGGSTMLYSAPDNFLVRSFDPVPAVLAIYSR